MNFKKIGLGVLVLSSLVLVGCSNSNNQSSGNVASNSNNTTKTVKHHYSYKDNVLTTPYYRYKIDKCSVVYAQASKDDDEADPSTDVNVYYTVTNISNKSSKQIHDGSTVDIESYVDVYRHNTNITGSDENLDFVDTVDGYKVFLNDANNELINLKPGQSKKIVETIPITLGFAGNKSDFDPLTLRIHKRNNREALLGTKELDIRFIKDGQWIKATEQQNKANQNPVYRYKVKTYR